MGELGQRGAARLSLALIGLLAACCAERPESASAQLGAGSVGNGSASGQAGSAALASGRGSASPDTRTRQFEVVRCAEARPEANPPDSACHSAGNAEFGLLIRGDILKKGQVLRGGAVAVDASGVISCADCACPIDDRALVIDCPDSVVSPGLINAHDHLSYANNPPVQSEERYEDRAEWRLGLRGHTAISYSGRASSAAISAQEFRLLLSGVTSVAGGAGRPGLVRNLDVPGLSEGLFVGHIDSDTFPLGDTNGVGHSADCAYNKARMTQGGVAAQSAYLPHLAEGIDELSRNELVCSEGGSYDLLGSTSAVVHAVGIGAAEAGALAQSRSWVVWSPRSNLSLYGNTAPVTLLTQLGVELVLGTDWLLSGSMNLTREVACARALSERAFKGVFSDFDLFNMVTSHAARALGVGRGLGALEPGYVADLAIFAKSGRADHLAAIQTSPAGVQLVLRGGRALYGDAALLRAFGAADCEALDVCGSPKSACLLGDAGLTLTALRAAGEAIYPLFSCGAAPNEPSCAPSRPGEYTPQTSAGDRDGDGIPDDRDLCPEVFDPIRPLDRGAEADYDADGLGDACDPCPFVAETCAAVARDDRDGDGIDDARDNCPEHANASQLDSDGDGQGDACDPCPAPNPGLTPCPVVIRQLSDPSMLPRIPLGTAVVLHGVYVTALRPMSASSNGFFVEDPSLERYSGLSVFSGSVRLGVEVGQRLTVHGYAGRFQGTPELTEPAVELEQGAGP